MKKKIVITLFFLLMMTFIGCGAEEAKETEIKEAKEILDTVWATYGEDEKFSVVGGDYTNMVADEPGVVDLSVPTEVDGLLGFPADFVSKVDDAASLMHMMNANSFTVGAFHITESNEIENIINAITENMETRQWLCGMPDKMVIVTIDEYVVSFFGSEEIADTFNEKLLNCYETAIVSVEQSMFA